MSLFEDELRNSEAGSGDADFFPDRRKGPRAPTLRSNRTSRTMHRWDLELVPAVALERLSDSINALQARSLERNIFFNSSVLRAAWPRLTTLLAPHGCWMLCLWETIEQQRHLRCFFPVGVTGHGLPRRWALAPLSNIFMPVGTPLLDRECAQETAEILFELLADPDLGLPPMIDFGHQRQSGPTLAVLQSAAANLGLIAKTNNCFTRAALTAPKESSRFPVETLSSKRKRELARQLRLLRETAEVDFVSARTENEVLDAFEYFMALELSSWKGRGGSALYNHKKIASFSRQIIAELTATGCCEIFWMRQKSEQGTSMIGGVVLLGSEGHFVPWKMAYDEKFATYSPGMQVMLQSTLNLIADPAFVEADSLASEDHWMMNHLWPDRIALADLTVLLQPNRSPSGLKQYIAAKERKLRMRRLARRYLGQVRRRLRSR